MNSFFTKYYKNDKTREVASSLWKNWLDSPGITNKDPEEVVQYLLDNELKPATIKKCLYIYKKWHESKNSNKDIKAMIKYLTHTEEPPDPKSWTKEEVERAISLSHLDKQMYNLMIVGLHTGMRKGEIFNLKWRDIDFIKGRIKIRKTKNGYPRNIPMTEKVEEIFHKCYTVGVDSDKYCFEKFDPNPRLKKICKLAGIREITFHGLRHTHATLALEAGRSPRMVAAMLGHNKVSTTINLYWQNTGEDMDLSFLP